MFVDRICVPENYIPAILQAGPAPSIIAVRLGVTIARVKKDLHKMQDIRSVYGKRLDDLSETIQRFGANRTILSQYYDVPRHYVEAWIQENPAIRQAFHDYDESFVDIAEYNMMIALQNREPWATRDTLQAKGAERGWGNKVKVDVSEELAKLGLSHTVIIRELALVFANSQGDASQDDTSSDTFIEAENSTVQP